MKSPLKGTDTTYDVLGIGFGPSNLALAIAIDEQNARLPPDERLNALFLERQSGFGWHRGMLIDDATMQVSFLKDLVTLRDPSSDYSFLCFLRERGRLIDFLNQKTLFPLRVEFHEYFEWAAERVRHLTAYEHVVTAIDPVRDESGAIAHFDVVCRDPGRPGRTVTYRARDISVAVGLEPHVPPGVELTERVWHNSQLLPRVAELTASGAPVRRAVVLGAGQSAAETVDYLHRSFPDAEVCAVFAKYGYTPADDSPFANRIFDPEAVDVYFGAPSEVKQSLFDYHRSTNYSVVDMELIEALYATAYQEKVAGRERLRFLNVSRIRDVLTRPDGSLDIAVEFLPTGDQQVLNADVLVHATGYRPRDLGTLLGEAAKVCLRDDGDALRVSRDHRVETAPDVTAGIYLQGSTEHTHGLTSSLLSTTAIRAGEIHRSLVSRRVAAA
ncbi:MULTISPECIES: lysine N(6)-hydroxylase/L-ornithine N(5)-oxygenase family protein [Streptomyces]|uniref:L-lysine N6-monooxygenase MbtG n=1 Tax=Streptomyces doudnae TaxID=3075536 RepID=A0ABD5EQ12_9ACTN|nr:MULTISPECIES: SidA/IucD/PvdA family monooxygenase [unclassified Streptomyces]MDT0436778.1 SidA/IucD/PvdA family monooxygenase [Streptomyces sp. DSM 41981]MYQ62453.1 SidA/IucD/PvdA family monooxygenase [Streptomyces sp. SID4950]SCD37902.1 L-ornithine N5-oxygenase [Streptomyces sp. SolWspMP-5a-2]